MNDNVKLSTEDAINQLMAEVVALRAYSKAIHGALVGLAKVKFPEIEKELDDQVLSAYVKQLQLETQSQPQIAPFLEMLIKSVL